MIDIFLHEDVTQLFKDKNVVFMGDSNIRALYKDFLCLMTTTQYISQKTLRTKMENSCYGDKLVTHGPRSNGRCYREERKISFKNTQASFYFLTCVYDKYVADILDRLSKSKLSIPDVIIINSCLWDVTRWGPKGVESFKKNLETLMKELKRVVPDCLVIWVTAPPIAADLKGGFLVKELEFLKYSLRFHVMEANFYARKIVVSHGFDVLDSHYHLKTQLHRRCDDGIHWYPEAVRYVTNLIYSHISLAWDVPLPHRYKPDIDVKDLQKNSQTSNSTASKKASKDSVAVNTNENILTENMPECKNGKDHFQKPRKPRKKKAKFDESHHAYLSRVRHNERQKRIREWQTFDSTPPRAYFNAIYDTPYIRNQNDSGYFPSPVNSPLLPLPIYNQHNMLSPSRIPMPFGPYPNYRYSPIGYPSPERQPFRFGDIYQQPPPVFDFTQLNSMPFGIEF